MFLKEDVCKSQVPGYYNETPQNPHDNLQYDYRRLQDLTETGLHDVNPPLLYLYLTSETLPYLVQIDEPWK